MHNYHWLVYDIFMGISERREREKTERRNAILGSARDLILLQGVERVSMEEIARRAELSKATVYLYFSGKDVLLNEICEESAMSFLERFKPCLDSGLTGMSALKCFWRRYLEVFGASNEMLLIFQVRMYLNSWPAIAHPQEPSKSPYVDAILGAMKTMIAQCKAEGVFDAALDLDHAIRILLSLFSSIVESASRPDTAPDGKKPAAIMEEATRLFQIIIYGFAKEGVPRSRLDITAN